MAEDLWTPSFSAHTAPMPQRAASVTNGKLQCYGHRLATIHQDYSTTNIQVAGVDEADTVKTDGQYIYTVSTTQNNGYYYYSSYSSQTSNISLHLNADPQNPKVVSKITLGNELNPQAYS